MSKDRESAETSISLFGRDKYCTIYAGHRWSIKWLKKMIELHEDEVRNVVVYEDGDMSAEIPMKCMMYIRWPNKRTTTPKEKAKMVERGKMLGEMKKQRDKQKAEEENENPEPSVTELDDDLVEKEQEERIEPITPMKKPTPPATRTRRRRAKVK